MADNAQVVGAAIGGIVGSPILLATYRSVRRWLTGTAEAEARLTNVKADNLVIDILTKEVSRLSIELASLRADNLKLASRVMELEGILRLPPNTPEFQAKLDAIDRAERKRGSDA